MLTETFGFVPPPTVLGPRERLAWQRRRWWLERRREFPCWLGSLLLHALVVIVLGSLTTPITSDNTLGSLQLHATYTGEARWGGTTTPVDLADDEPQPALAEPPLEEIANLRDDGENAPAADGADEADAPTAALADDASPKLLAANDRPPPTLYQVNPDFSTQRSRRRGRRLPTPRPRRQAKRSSRRPPVQRRYRRRRRQRV